MPQPYPGQEWRHGWVPVTPAAAKSKNHGRKPAASSLLSRVVAEAAESLNRMKEQDAKRDREAKTAKAETTRGQRQPSTKARTKPGKKVGVDARNAPLREGDEVTITQGPNRGKTGRVAGKGRYGAISVDADGKRQDLSPANLRSKADQETSKKADAAIREATGRPSGGDVPIGEIQNQVRDAYGKLAAKPGDWVNLADLRPLLGRSLPRARVDEALTQMNRQADVNFVPESNQKTMTQRHKDAAVHFGGQNKHLVSISR